MGSPFCQNYFNELSIDIGRKLRYSRLFGNRGLLPDVDLSPSKFRMLLTYGIYLANMNLNILFQWIRSHGFQEEKSWYF